MLCAASLGFTSNSLHLVMKCVSVCMRATQRASLLGASLTLVVVACQLNSAMLCRVRIDVGAKTADTWCADHETILLIITQRPRCGLSLEGLCFCRASNTLDKFGNPIVASTNNFAFFPGQLGNILHPRKKQPLVAVRPNLKFLLRASV